MAKKRSKGGKYVARPKSPSIKKAARAPGLAEYTERVFGLPSRNFVEVFGHTVWLILFGWARR